MVVLEEQALDGVCADDDSFLEERAEKELPNNFPYLNNNILKGKLVFRLAPIKISLNVPVMF